jgi:antitoxin (DNA-binding transcriptional repressor) of toxin-antitoxin stability system
MHAEISIDSTCPQLRELLERLPSGEMVNIRGADGTRVAILVAVKPPTGKPQSFPDWLARLDSLAQRVATAWKGETSALETLSGMRR